MPAGPAAPAAPAAPLADPAPVARGRWVVLAGVWLVYFCFGLVAASFAPLIGPIRADLGIGDAAMGLILGAWPLVYIFAALPAGMMLDRFGPRAGILAAALLIALSAACRATAGTPGAMLVAVGIFGLGGPLISVGAPQLIAGLFRGRDRARAMGIYITGPALGGILALGLTNSVLMPLLGGSWRAVLLLHAGVALAGGLVWLLAARRIGAAPPGSAAPRFRPRDIGALLRSPSVGMLLALGVGIFFVNHALNNWLPQVLIWQGFSATGAGWLAALPQLVGLPAALLVPQYVPERHRIAALAGLVACFALATLLLQSGWIGTVTAGLVLHGLARGTMMTMAMLILLDLPGLPQDRPGLAGGMFFTTAEIGGVMGPVTFGLLSQATGGQALPLLALGAMCLAMLALLWRLHRPG